MPAPTALYRVYRLATRALAPIAYRKVAAKLAAGGVSEVRQRERLGYASVPRPDGRLIWFHGASVGESLSVLSVMGEMGRRCPDLSFLLTSGTATSARIVADRLPVRTRHQFAALDAPGPVRRFLDHWQPEAAIFVESELWPVTLMETQARGVKLALLNARLSEGSRTAWGKRPASAAMLMGCFDILISQNAEQEGYLRDMGAPADRIRTGANLKSVGAPLPVDPEALARMQTALQGRPVWAASSTHPGEEEVVLDAHRALLKRWPDLCLILIPRHPERGDDVETLIRAADLPLARRSRDEALTGDTSVYLADTLGETGLWYTLCPVVFLGGGLAKVGGHNPFEPARAGAAVMTGPHVFNFSETFAPLIETGGVVDVHDAKAIIETADLWLTDPGARSRVQSAAEGFVTSADKGAMEAVLAPLMAALGLERDDA
ncbi:3-deoxy-D-manno-octulosonic acid transferase [Chachezhania antarctica]|uniref:3-deoxy-D-manno-octulosonic acid transferase n=1 Tax=Chachezhania antarctica TaxID=2340860 RepID=UPI000EB0EFF7|nr:3-deoxy-D-manno-octulosonic acid transferase [Chachezhania antarctica]|tara:strand:+ start:272 stop:1573 length:1302 start_codon:yes stop_codon:yes gene_type:complete